MPPTKPSPPPMRSSTVDLARLDDVPVAPFGHDGAPEVAVGADDLAQRGGEDRGVGIGLPGPVDHALEAVDLARQALAARLRALDAQAELEVLLVADEDVGDAGDLVEDRAQLLLAALPERGPVVQVEGDARAVLLGGPGELQAEASRSRATGPRSGPTGGRSARPRGRRSGRGRSP